MLYLICICFFLISISKTKKHKERKNIKSKSSNTTNIKNKQINFKKRHCKSNDPIFWNLVWPRPVSPAQSRLRSKRFDYLIFSLFLCFLICSLFFLISSSKTKKTQPRKPNQNQQKDNENHQKKKTMQIRKSNLSEPSLAQARGPGPEQTRFQKIGLFDVLCFCRFLFLFGFRCFLWFQAPRPKKHKKNRKSNHNQKKTTKITKQKTINSKKRQCKSNNLIFWNLVWPRPVGPARSRTGSKRLDYLSFIVVFDFISFYVVFIVFLISSSKTKK